MNDNNLTVPVRKSLEALKQQNQHGAEYWTARKLNAGYKGLYGGLGKEAIKTRKRIPAREQLLDRMDTTELAANQFRMTQTRDKLARENVRDQQRAIRTHNQVGKEVRDAIKRIGGTLPENIPPAEHIKQVRKRIATTPAKLQLEEKEAKGLAGK